MIRIITFTAIALSLGGCAFLAQVSDEIQCEAAWHSPPWHPLSVPPNAPCAPYLQRR